MKTWQKYDAFKSTGEWHIHTSFTDGSDTIDQYCMRAVELDLPLIAFTEHIRKNPKYDFNQFLIEIDSAREIFDLVILSGCEVKVLPDGSMDIEDSILNMVDYPVFAYHSFPSDEALLASSFECVLKDYRINTWAHPLTWLEKWRDGVNRNSWEWIFELMNREQVAFELNEKYPLDRYPEFLHQVKKAGVGFVRGSDVHSCNDLCAISSSKYLNFFH